MARNARQMHLADDILSNAVIEDVVAIHYPEDSEA